MKARKWIVGISLFILLSALMACSKSSDLGDTLDLERDQAIETTNEEDYNLEVLKNEADSYAISFNGPSEAETLKVRVYRLDSEGWGLIDSRSISKAAGDDRLSGVFEMETSDDYEISFILENTDEKIVYSTEKIVLEGEIIEEDKILLAQSKEASLNKEIPLGLIIYSSELGIGEFRLDDFYEFENLKDLDLVQAISFEFLDK